MSAELKKQVCDVIDTMAGELVEASHAIHANPEIAFEETFAHGLLTDKVAEHGLEVERHACGLDTAFISSFGADNKGDATVGILSEYDALPGIGHACGHNIIATTGLGAALALSKLGGDLPGRVRYLGTPAEESGNGKELMARQGAFDGLDAAMMVHPAGVDLITMPSLAVNEVRVTYTGKPSHASAMPHAGINALDGLVTAYQSIAQLRQHIKQSERIHGIFNEAGLAPNIVPDRAVGTFMCAPKTAWRWLTSKSACKTALKPAHWRPVVRCKSTGRWAIIWKLRIVGRLPNAISKTPKALAAISSRLRKCHPVVPVRPIWAMSAIACHPSIR